MIIVSEGGLAEIQESIVNALLSASDHRGRPRIHKTIDPDLLSRLALGVLSAAAGEAVMVHGAEVLEKAPEESFPWLKTVYPRG